jgi:cytochrome b
MAAQTARVHVWDPFVRLSHWALAAAFLVAYFSHGGYLAEHRIAGYVITALVILRLLWGFVGSRRARFADFVPAPRELAAYLGDVVCRREARHIGHNPAGGAMIVLLLFLLAALCITGFVLDTPGFRDDRDFKAVHDLLTDATVVCIALHIAGVGYASWRHRENLVAAMITGRKRATPFMSAAEAPPRSP